MRPLDGADKETVHRLREHCGASVSMRKRGGGRKELELKLLDVGRGN